MKWGWSVDDVMLRRDGLRIWKILKKESAEVRPWCWEVGVRPWCWEVGVRPWCWEVEVRPWCWEVGVRPWCWEVGVRPWCWEVGVRPWCWEVEVRPWCWEVEVRPWCWEIKIGQCRQTIELLPLRQRMEFSVIQLSSLPLWRRLSFSGPDQRRWIETPRDVPNVGGVVSIVWLRKTFKNCVSLLVSKNWNQKLINRSYLNNREFACVFAYVYVLLLLIALNYGYELYATRGSLHLADYNVIVLVMLVRAIKRR